MDSSLRDIYEKETNQPLALRLFGKVKESTLKTLLTSNEEVKENKTKGSETIKLM